MRFLFTFAGGSGHFEPLVPLARAATAAGHTVAITGQAAMLPAITAAGFTALATAGATLSSTPARQPLLTVDRAREERDLRDGFAGRLARTRAAALLALCGTWQPDLIVCDEVDFGAMIAAERLGLPYATVLVIAAGSFVRTAVVSAVLNEIRAEYDLPPDPDLVMLRRYLVIAPFPPSYRDPAFPLPATAHAMRPSWLATPALPSAPPWAVALPAAPTIYFTLGTVFNVESGDLFERVLAGLRELPVNVIATVGRELDPAIFGPQPPHLQLVRFLPQTEVLPHCAAVICHGGSGSVMGALAHGLPLVLLPMGADQPDNADRCVALGVARQLDALAVTPAAVREAVTTVLTDATYRQRAQQLQAEIAGLPPVAQLLPLLETLAHRLTLSINV